MQLVLLALSVLAAGLPMTGFVSLVWWMDRYDREPLWMVVLAFGWGAVGAIGIATFGSILVSLGVNVAFAGVGHPLDPENLGMAVDAVLIAPLVEEPSKALILLPIALSRHFDNMTDGFVYGAVIGLGFGMTENLLYFVSVSGDLGTWIGTVAIRTFYSAIMHATATAAVGAGLGWGRYRGGPITALCGTLGLGLAMGVHAGWNGLLSLAQATELAFVWHIDLVLLPALVIATFVVFEACVLEETWIIKHELKKDVEAGRIPSHHPTILASWWRRLGSSWLPQGVDKHQYITLATNLAMRRHQIRLMGESAPQWLTDDVARICADLEKTLPRPR